MTTDSIKPLFDPDSDSADGPEPLSDYLKDLEKEVLGKILIENSQTLARASQKIIQREDASIETQKSWACQISPKNTLTCKLGSLGCVVNHPEVEEKAKKDWKVKQLIKVDPGDPALESNPIFPTKEDPAYIRGQELLAEIPKDELALLNDQTKVGGEEYLRWLETGGDYDPINGLPKPITPWPESLVEDLQEEMNLLKSTEEPISESDAAFSKGMSVPGSTRPHPTLLANAAQAVSGVLKNPDDLVWAQVLNGIHKATVKLATPPEVKVIAYDRFKTTWALFFRTLGGLFLVTLDAFRAMLGLGTRKLLVESRGEIIAKLNKVARHKMTSHEDRNLIKQYALRSVGVNYVRHMLTDSFMRELDKQEKQEEMQNRPTIVWPKEEGVSGDIK